MGISWESNGKITGKSWKYYGHIMGISWENHGNIMGISLNKNHGNIMDKSLANHGGVMENHRDTMGIEYHGKIMGNITINNIHKWEHNQQLMGNIIGT